MKRLRKRFQHLSRDDCALFAFMTVAAFVIVLLCSGIVVHAEDFTFDFVTLYKLPSSIDNDTSSQFPFVNGTDTFTYGDYTFDYNTVYQNTIDNGSFNVSTSFNLDNLPHYAVCSWIKGDTSFKLIPLVDDSFVVGNANGVRIYMNKEQYESVYGKGSYTYSMFSFRFNLNDSSFPFWQYLNLQSYNARDSILVDGETYYQVFANMGTDIRSVILSDVPCYYSDNLDINSLDGLENVNSNVGGGNKKQIEDNMYLGPNAVLYFNNSTFESGALTIYPDLNNNQKDGNYSLILDTTARYDVSYNNNFDGINPIILYKTLSLKKYYDIGSTTANLEFTSEFSLPSSYFSDGFEELSLTNLNDDLVNSSGQSVIPIASAFSNSNVFLKYFRPATNYVSTLSGLDSIGVNNVFLDYKDGPVRDIDYILDSVVYDFKLFIMDNDTGEKSELLLQTVYQTSDSGTTQEEVYRKQNSIDDIVDAVGGSSGVLPSGYQPVNGLPSELPNAYYNGVDNMYNGSSSGSSSSSSAGGGGGAIGDNSQVVNIYPDDDSEYMDGLINKLVPSRTGKGGLSESIIRFANTNGWISIMKTTFNFVPDYVWDTLGIFIVSGLGLLGVALVISLIKNLL